MDERLRKTIRNNNDLYGAVFSNLHVSFQETEEIWYSLEKAPPYYSNVVTRSRTWKPDEVFRKLDSTAIQNQWAGWSIKDSFSTLDLTLHGFNQLFQAQWMYLDVEHFNPITPHVNVEYKILAKEEEISAWRLAWDPNIDLGKRIFSPGLVKNPKIHFIASYQGDQLVSGCLVNQTDDVLGISNFFSPGNDISYWSDTICHILSSIGRMDIVGYERRELVKNLRNLGFQSIGDLIVWVKSIKTI